MSQQRLGAANQARQEATNAIVGGVGSLAGGVLGGMADGVIGTATSLGQKLSGAYSKNGKIT